VPIIEGVAESQGQKVEGREPRMKSSSGFLFLCTLLFAAVADAAEVYRWTDEAGRVHFGERPPPGGAERIELQQQAAPPPGDTGMAERRARQQRMLEAFEYERERKRQRALETQQSQQRKDDYCRGLQRRLRFLDHAGPIYLRRDDGTREYLDDGQRAAQRREVEAARQRHCDGL
jgi:hypothetical protein